MDFLKVYWTYEQLEANKVLIQTPLKARKCLLIEEIK